MIRLFSKVSQKEFRAALSRFLHIVEHCLLPVSAAFQKHLIVLRTELYIAWAKAVMMEIDDICIIGGDIFDDMLKSEFVEDLSQHRDRSTAGGCNEILFD